jgi:hypothetical protein
MKAMMMPSQPSTSLAAKKTEVINYAKIKRNAPIKVTLC